MTLETRLNTRRGKKILAKGIKRYVDKFNQLKKRNAPKPVSLPVPEVDSATATKKKAKKASKKSGK